MDDDLRRRLREAIELYNCGRYFESQEHFEAVHNECDEGDRDLPQALLMAACGMHLHFHRGGGRGALNLLRQSLLILDGLGAEREGVATADFNEALFAYLEELQSRKKRGAGFFDRWLAPKIPFA